VNGEGDECKTRGDSDGDRLPLRAVLRLWHPQDGRSEYRGDHGPTGVDCVQPCADRLRGGHRGWHQAPSRAARRAHRHHRYDGVEHHADRRRSHSRWAHAHRVRHRLRDHRGRRSLVAREIVAGVEPTYYPSSAATSGVRKSPYRSRALSCRAMTLNHGVSGRATMGGEGDENLIAYCGLYCGDCHGYQGKIPDLARDLRKESRKA